MKGVISGKIILVVEIFNYLAETHLIRVSKINALQIYKLNYLRNCLSNDRITKIKLIHFTTQFFNPFKSTVQCAGKKSNHLKTLNKILLCGCKILLNVINIRYIKKPGFNNLKTDRTRDLLLKPPG